MRTGSFLEKEIHEFTQKCSGSTDQFRCRISKFFSKSKKFLFFQSELLSGGDAASAILTNGGTSQLAASISAQQPKVSFFDFLFNIFAVVFFINNGFQFSVHI